MHIKGGVIMVFFDLPQLNKEERKKYIKFVNGLKYEGFIMFQESVYIRQIKNIRLKNYDINRVKKYAPEEGNIRILVLTYKQFEEIINVIGDKVELDKRRIIVI